MNKTKSMEKEVSPIVENKDDVVATCKTTTQTELSPLAKPFAPFSQEKQISSSRKQEETKYSKSKKKKKKYLPKPSANQLVTQVEKQCYTDDLMTIKDQERRQELMKNENNALSSTASYAAIFQGAFYNLLYILRIYGKPSCGALVNNLDKNIVYSAKLQASDQLELFPIILLNMLQDPEIHIKRFFIPAAIDEIEIYFEFGSDNCVRKALQTMSRKTTYFSLKKVFSTRPVTPEFIIGSPETPSSTNEITIISSSQQNSFGGKKFSKIKNIQSIFKEKL